MATGPKETKAQARDRLREERARQAAAEKRARRTPADRPGRGRRPRGRRRRRSWWCTAGRRRSTRAPRCRQGVTDTKGYPTGTATKPVLDIWEDFQCPTAARSRPRTGRPDRGAGHLGQGAGRVPHVELPGPEEHEQPGVDTSSPRRARRSPPAARGTRASSCRCTTRSSPTSRRPRDTGWTDTAAGDVREGRRACRTRGTFDQCLSVRKYEGFVSQGQRAGGQAADHRHADIPGRTARRRRVRGRR